MILNEIFNRRKEDKQPVKDNQPKANPAKIAAQFRQVRDKPDNKDYADGLWRELVNLVGVTRAESLVSNQDQIVRKDDEPPTDVWANVKKKK